jgi:hypothetical protein
VPGLISGSGTVPGVGGAQCAGGRRSRSSVRVGTFSRRPVPAPGVATDAPPRFGSGEAGASRKSRPVASWRERGAVGLAAGLRAYRRIVRLGPDDLPADCSLPLPPAVPSGRTARGLLACAPLRAPAGGREGADRPLAESVRKGSAVGRSVAFPSPAWFGYHLWFRCRGFHPTCRPACHPVLRLGVNGH